jgi:hypothetical protein
MESACKQKRLVIQNKTNLLLTMFCKIINNYNYLPTFVIYKITEQQLAVQPAGRVPAPQPSPALPDLQLDRLLRGRLRAPRETLSGAGNALPCRMPPHHCAQGGG